MLSGVHFPNLQGLFRPAFSKISIFLNKKQLFFKKGLRPPNLHDMIVLVDMEDIQHNRYGQLAQLAEQRTLNPWVQGSIP